MTEFQKNSTKYNLKITIKSNICMHISERERENSLRLEYMANPLACIYTMLISVKEKDKQRMSR
jgi:hypothetical protein